MQREIERCLKGREEKNIRGYPSYRVGKERSRVRRAAVAASSGTSSSASLPCLPAANSRERERELERDRQGKRERAGTRLTPAEKKSSLYRRKQFSPSLSLLSASLGDGRGARRKKELTRRRSDGSYGPGQQFMPLFQGKLVDHLGKDPAVHVFQSGFNHLISASERDSFKMHKLERLKNSALRLIMLMTRTTR